MDFEITNIDNYLNKVFSRTYYKRKIVNLLICSIFFITTIITIFPLFHIFSYVCINGISSINLAFFIKAPVPIGETGGGMGPALLGSLILISIGCSIGLPIGMATGVYLSEYSYSKIDNIIRFCCNLLASTPSMIIGLFIYTILVLPFNKFSAISGGVALGIIMIPIIAKSCEELLKLVPTQIREAGLALGIARWKVIVFIVIRGSFKSLLSAFILAISRIAGETAPLLFTSFNNSFWSLNITKPISSLPIQIYTYAISPFNEWHNQAFAGSLVLIVLIFCINLTIRTLLKYK